MQAPAELQSLRVVVVDFVSGRDSAHLPIATCDSDSMHHGTCRPGYGRICRLQRRHAVAILAPFHQLTCAVRCNLRLPRATGTRLIFFDTVASQQHSTEGVQLALIEMCAGLPCLCACCTPRACASSSPLRRAHYRCSRHATAAWSCGVLCCSTMQVHAKLGRQFGVLRALALQHNCALVLPYRQALVSRCQEPQVSRPTRPFRVLTASTVSLSE